MDLKRRYENIQPRKTGWVDSYISNSLKVINENLSKLPMLITPIIYEAKFTQQEFADWSKQSKVNSIGGGNTAGFACKTDIPAENISGVIDKDGTKVGSVLPAAERTETIYFIDAKPRQEVFAKGTNYHLDLPENSHGHVLYFKSVANAENYASSRLHGKTYDSAAGWRINNDWTAQQLAEVYAGVVRQEQQHQQPQAAASAARLK